MSFTCVFHCEDWLFAPGYWLCKYYYFIIYIYVDVRVKWELVPYAGAVAAPPKTGLLLQTV